MRILLGSIFPYRPSAQRRIFLPRSLPHGRFRALALIALPLFSLVVCSSEQSTAPAQLQPPALSFAIESRIRWFRDSAFTNFLYPAATVCDTVAPGLVSCNSSWDYSCTEFPDTFWGLTEYTPEQESLYCHSDTCWALHDTAVYDMHRYLAWQANALCTPGAFAYTRIGLCYQFSPGESTVTVFNTLFDTTFTATFCLPKLPLDTLDMVYLVSNADTFSLPADTISAYDDYLTSNAFPRH